MQHPNFNPHMKQATTDQQNIYIYLYIYQVSYTKEIRPLTLDEYSKSIGVLTIFVGVLDPGTWHPQKERNKSLERKLNAYNSLQRALISAPLARNKSSRHAKENKQKKNNNLLDAHKKTRRLQLTATHLGWHEGSLHGKRRHGVSPLVRLLNGRDERLQPFLVAIPCGRHNEGALHQARQGGRFHFLAPLTCPAFFQAQKCVLLAKMSIRLPRQLTAQTSCCFFHKICF